MRYGIVSDLFKDVSRHGFFRLELGAQIGVILLSALLSYSIYRLLKPRFDSDKIRWQWFSKGLIRLVFPLVALTLLSVGSSSLSLLLTGSHFYLIMIAMLVLQAMLSIAVLFYLFEHVFHKAPWLVKFEWWLAKTIWIAYALHLFGLLPKITRFLDDINFSVGKDKLSVLLVVNGVLYLAIILLIAMWLSLSIERCLMGAKMLDTTLRVMITKVIQTILVIITILIAMHLIGIDPTVLSVFGGAFGVGLGLGLQKIASNYVSGFIILLDRSIRMGDLVQIADHQGVISRVTSRYVVLKGIDGTEALVPNDTLVTTTVINQSYTEKLIWVKMTFTVGYESDIDLVLELLVDAAKKSDRVVKDPEPYPYLDSFGDSAVNVGVGFWLKDPENGQGALKSEINRRVWRAFREHGINIPFNRLDVVHFKPSNELAGDGNLQGCNAKKVMSERQE